MRRRFFTRPELVAAVACAGMLAALALPSLADAREKARAADCAGRLRRIGMAGFAYAEAHLDYGVPHIAGDLRGWPRVLMAFDRSFADGDFRCPDDTVARPGNAPPYSYSLSVGHLWNVKQSPTNRGEWGMASVITGAALRLSRAPVPSRAVWFFENHEAGNNARQAWQAGDRQLWTTYTLAGYHGAEATNRQLYLDGRVEAVAAAAWGRGSPRGVIFPDLHPPGGCHPNQP